MTYALVTFGCRVNQADSLRIEQQLRARGAIGARPEDADLVIVNTCSVTASADQSARQAIRRITRSNPSVRVVATGCYAPRRPSELLALSNVLSIVPNIDKDGLVDGLADGGVTFTGERFAGGEGACGRTLTPGSAGRTAFTLGVQTGCEEQCSYCIIPDTRGRARSRPLDAVARDSEWATAAGYREIAITGVHLGSYGRDLGKGATLTDLVRTLAEWDADVLFRLSSLEPMDCTESIVDLVASSSRLAPHFHLPLQHGCDEVLKAMRRPYTVGFYRDLIARIKRDLPHAAVGSDIIVGFPGETERQYAEMWSVLNELPLSHLHVFPYSDRPGTAAAKMLPKVDGRTISERGQSVRQLGARMVATFRRAQEGSVRRALTVDDGWSAVTDNYVKVNLPEQHERNEWVQVTL